MKTNPDVFVENTLQGIDKVLQSNGKYAFLLESAMNDYYAQRDCRLIRVGDLLDSKGYGIGFPTGNFVGPAWSSCYPHNRFPFAK